MKEIKYICRECALKAGGVWPDGHIATCNILKCDMCSKKTTVCNISNWNIDIRSINYIYMTEEDAIKKVNEICDAFDISHGPERLHEVLQEITEIALKFSNKK